MIEISAERKPWVPEAPRPMQIVGRKGHEHAPRACPDPNDPDTYFPPEDVAWYLLGWLPGLCLMGAVLAIVMIEIFG